jgi:cell division protein FtsB
MKKAWFILAILFSLYLIVGLSRSIWQLYKAGDQVFEAEKIKIAEEQRNNELRKELEASKSADFVERAARDKLNMARPGEVVLIVPDTGVKEEKKKEEVAVVQEANFRKWIRLFE